MFARRLAVRLQTESAVVAELSGGLIVVGGLHGKPSDAQRRRQCFASQQS